MTASIPIQRSFTFEPVNPYSTEGTIFEGTAFGCPALLENRLLAENPIISQTLGLTFYRYLLDYWIIATFQVHVEKRLQKKDRTEDLQCVRLT